MKSFEKIGRIALLLIACTFVAQAGAAEPGGAPTAAKPPSGPNEVSIGFNVFVPETLTIPVGTTVTWVNNDGSNHNVIFADQTKSGRLRHDATWTRTFTAPGSYDYKCAIHGDMMKGKVVVQ